jgi:hypothetical protein
MNSTNEATNLCIPRVFPNINESRIRKIFEELNIGRIGKIDIIHKTSKTGDKFNRVFVHLLSWYHNENASKAKQRIIEGKEFKIIYDDPWFWKVSEYREPNHHNEKIEHHPVQKKPSLQFDDNALEEIKQNQYRYSNHHNNNNHNNNNHNNKPTNNQNNQNKEKQRYQSPRFRREQEEYFPKHHVNKKRKDYEQPTFHERQQTRPQSQYAVQVSQDKDNIEEYSMCENEYHDNIIVDEDTVPLISYSEMPMPSKKRLIQKKAQKQKIKIENESVTISL